MSPLSVGIVHPAFQNLKKAGRFLHLIAAVLIITNALTYLRQPDASKIFFWCQVIVAADIFILVFAGREMLSESPRFNLFFRLAEGIAFVTVGILLLMKGEWVTGSIQLIIAAGYFYLFHCERKSFYAERIAIQHLGVVLPGFPSDKLVYWIHIRKFHADYHGVQIETDRDEKFTFNFKQNLQPEELEEIHEFCRHYLK